MATSKKRRRDPERTMALKDHLRELRNRLIKAAIGILLGAIAGFFLYDWLVQVLAEPILGYDREGQLAEIAFNTVGGPLDLLIRLSLFVGIVVSSPVWLYQIWAFIMPGLKKTEKRYAVGFISASVPLFLLGLAAAYSVLPQAVGFFLALNPEGTSSVINPDIYFTFVLQLFLAFGIAMVIPVVLVGVNMMGLVTGKQVLKAWRGVVMLIAVISALAAPGGDAVTMFFLALPLTLLFGIAILLCLLNDRRRRKRESSTEAEIDELLQD